MVTESTAQKTAATAVGGLEASSVSSQRITDDDGHVVEIFPLPTDEATLERLLRELFEVHWDKIVFGPIIQGAAWEFQASHAPTHVGLLDGYLTVAFGASHFHLCIGPTHGPRHSPTPEALAQHRRCTRAEFFRRLDTAGAPTSWGLRLWNGHDEQQATVVFPNPFLSADGMRALKEPDWSRLALWDELRLRYVGIKGPDPVDRLGTRFRHD
jgi:hypothetical protein